MLSLDDAINLYLQVDRSAFTNYSYASVLKRLSLRLNGGREIKDIAYAELLAYVGDLKSGIKPTTLARYAATIRYFFSWVAEMGYVDISPAAGLRVRQPPKDRTQSRAIPANDLQKLLDYARKDPRDYAILLFLADTGCRVGGVASLRLSRLDLIENCARLDEKGDKIHRAWFGDETAAALRAWLKVRPAVDHEYVFVTSGDGRPLPRQSITAQVRRLSIKACGKVYSPHRIRHAVGHGLARAGVPVTVVQRKLGHANPKITLEFYYPDTDEEVMTTSREHSLVALGDRPKPVKPGKIIRLSDYG